MMAIKDLAAEVRAGKQFDIELTKAVRDQESYAEPGMRGRIVSVIDEGDGVARVQINLQPYDQHNDQLALPNYYDKFGNATLTGKQAGRYPKDHIESIWMNWTDQASEYFVMLEPSQAEAYSTYLRAANEQSYVAWLESQLFRTGWTPAAVGQAG